MNVRKIILSLAKLISGSVLSSRRPCNIAAFHLGRCGSRVLGDLLKQNRNIIWEGELFSPGRLNGIASRWPRLTRNRMSILNVRMKMAGRKCYGFETQPTQVEPMDMELTGYVQRLERLGFGHFVLIERRNYLHRIVSIVRGHQSSQWHSKIGDSPSNKPTKLDIDKLSLNWGTDTDPKPLIAHLQHTEQSTSALKQILSSRRHLYLTYEDDIKPQPELAYRRICEFAGIEYQPVTVLFKKTNPFELADVLTNFSEVERTLRGTSFEWMLYS